jgi:hypothetical protein
VTNLKLELVDTAVSSDPLDLARLRINPENLEGNSVKKLLTMVPVRRPGKQDFVRVHPDPAYRTAVMVLEFKEDDETYVVDLGAVPELQEECHAVTLYTGITRTGTLFLWPVKVPTSDRRGNSWHLSANLAAQHAMKSWVRIKANKEAGGYDVNVATSAIPDPAWPDLTFEAVFKIAFRDGLINSAEHPAVKRLLGG